MTARTNTELEAQLPSFIPLIIQNPMASVRCPRCGGEFVVDGKRWRAPLMSTLKPELELRGRSCPYCSFTALVPEEFYPRRKNGAKR